nr:hypothetical protein [Tanacetum cinerariifolium]
MKWEADLHCMEMHTLIDLGDQTSNMVVAGVQCLIRIPMVFIVAVREGLIVELSSYSGSEPGGMYSSSSYDGDYISRDSDVDGSSYSSSMYSGRSMSGSGYMGSGSSGSYY